MAGAQRGTGTVHSRVALSERLLRHHPRCSSPESRSGPRARPSSRTLRCARSGAAVRRFIVPQILAVVAQVLLIVVDVLAVVVDVFPVLRDVLPVLFDVVDVILDVLLVLRQVAGILF